MSKYKLVTFDVTNTLLRMRSSVGLHYSKIASEHGVCPRSLDPDILTKCFSASWKQLNLEHPNFGRNSTNTPFVNGGWRAWWIEIVRMTFAKASHQLEPNLLAPIAESLIVSYGTGHCWDRIPGTLETLKSLRKADSSLIIGVISNSDPRLSSVLIETGLAPYFDFVVNSYDANCYKPQSEIFNAALFEATKYRLKNDKFVGNIEPKESLHVGNDVKLDYAGAQSAGWNALLVGKEDFDDINASINVDPLRVAKDLHDVPHFVL